MLACERCGSASSEGARFCQACGASLLPILAPNEERKLISVLVADLVGSTARADGADPEDVRDRLRRFFEPIRERIRHYDGSVEKFIGDAVVAVFGAPRAHGDDAQRAVRCALDIVQAVADLNARQPGLQLAVRIGVSTGEAVVALGFAHERGESLATGDVMNTAARLQAAAPADAVVVGSETWLATRRVIRYQVMPPVAAKGKPEPLAAWLAMSAVEPMVGMAARAPLIGRDGELELLTTTLKRVAAERRPSTVSVLGPAGIGKSRLIFEFAESVQHVGGHVLRGRCLPYQERRAYVASIGHVRTVAGILETDSPDVAREKLGRAVAEHLPSEEVADVGRYLSLLIGLGVDEPTEQRQPLFFAMRRLIEGVSRERPTVLIFEDLHWGEKSQFELLEYLCDQVRGVPVLFLWAARPELAEMRPALSGAPGAETTILLEPLSEIASAAVVNRLLDAAPVSVDVDRLLEIAGGNPLFIEELVATLPSSGDRAAALPTTVREAIAWRIDALPTELRTVLLDASVMGRTFWRGVLAGMSDARVDRLDKALADLTSRGLVRPVPKSQVVGDSEFSFKHTLVQEVAYRTLTRAARRERHATVARHIEGALGANARDLAATLAHHWREAGEPLRAVEYLLVAARRAGESWAQASVKALYEEALELADGDVALSSRIQLQQAISLADLAEFDAASAEFDQVLPRLSGREEVEAVIVRARVAYWLEDAEQARIFGDRGRKLAEVLGDRELLGPAIVSQGLAREQSGELAEAAALFDDARTSWLPGKRQRDFAALNEHAADIAYFRGDYRRAEQLARSAHELGGESHFIEPLLRSGGWRGLSLAAQGRTEDAIEWLDSIFHRAQELDPRWGAASLNYSSLAFRDLFMFKEARQRNEQALEIVSQRGAWGMPEMSAEIDLMFTDLAVGEVGRVQRKFPKLWDAAINGKAWRPWLGGGRLALVRAELARQADGPEEVVERARDAIDRATRVGRRKYEAAAQALLGEALVALGSSEQGVAELRAASAKADKLGSPSESWRIMSALARALYAIGDDDGAARAYRRSADVIGAYASSLKPMHARSFLAAEPVREVLNAVGGH
jgi:class 3 adenylate cyclase/tetratricopeptide (TPR) repeat protein